MKHSPLKRSRQWLPTIVVLAVVLLAGGRLLSLSVREHAAQKRAAAETVARQYGHGLEQQLQRLALRPAAPTRVGMPQVLASDQISLLLNRLSNAGYDFELAQPDATGHRQVFLNSRPEPLRDPIVSPIRAPARFAQDFPSGRLDLAIRPKTGWYPARELATALGLLAIVAWILAFGTHDLTHSLQRAQTALLATRRKLKAANQRLTTEIEQRESLQKSFEHARYHDAFTGLPNRRYFMDRLDRALREVRTRRRRRIAILLIDIDRFRLINDTLGHTASDELILQIARRFEKTMAEVDCLLARWSGDQLAVLLFDVPSADTSLGVADRLQEALREPFELRKHRLSVAARIGSTYIESGLQRAEDALREADIALSVAKRQESARAIAYLPSMGGDAANLVSLEADLHVALERNELRFLFQPIVDLHNGRAVGAEALLRWQHPVEGLLTPDKFLPTAEEAGLMSPLTRWTMARACAVAGDWQRRLPQGTNFYLSVNLSATSLRDPGLSRFMASLLEESHTSASTIKLELTEGGLIDNVGPARETLKSIHDLGIELMLDDFGTGYSSLSYLQLFPFDYVKIDRPFVDRTGSEEANSAVASAMVQMASSLGLKSIAEIVETQAAAQALTRMGCDYGQGYFFSAPLEAEEALLCLRGGTPGDESPTLILPALDQVS